MYLIGIFILLLSTFFIIVFELVIIIFLGMLIFLNFFFGIFFIIGIWIKYLCLYEFQWFVCYWLIYLVYFGFWEINDYRVLYFINTFVRLQSFLFSFGISLYILGLGLLLIRKFFNWTCYMGNAEFFVHWTHFFKKNY